MRGPKNHLRVVKAGPPGKGPQVQEDANAVAADATTETTKRKIEVPKFLKGNAKRIFIKLAAAPWITEWDTWKLQTLAVLTADFEANSKDTSAAILVNLRNLQNDLGFDPGIRERMKLNPQGAKSKAAKYFE